MLANDLLSKGLRRSFRKLDECRSLSISAFPNIIQVSSPTSAVVITYAKGTCAPYPDRPGDAIVQIVVLGKKNDVLQNFLHNAYVRSKCVSLRAIRFGKEVESLVIGVRVLEADGDSYRLCVAGINEVIQRLNLAKLFLPAYSRYALYSGTIVRDPTDSELAVSDCGIHVVMKSAQEMLYLEKTGGLAESEDVLRAVRLSFAEFSTDK